MAQASLVGAKSPGVGAKSPGFGVGNSGKEPESSGIGVPSSGEYARSPGLGLLNCGESPANSDAGAANSGFLPQNSGDLPPSLDAGARDSSAGASHSEAEVLRSDTALLPGNPGDWLSVSPPTGMPFSNDPPTLADLELLRARMNELILALRLSVKARKSPPEFIRRAQLPASVQLELPNPRMLF